MTTPNSLDLVSLDFDTLKANLKNFLKGQDQFKDYDFDGANISVLLDVLSYNTFLNSFYLNMVASESFLDSAQLKASVVSHAKELNYLPRSSRSSHAIVTLDFVTSANTPAVVVPKGTGFSTVVGSRSFTFYTDNTNIVYPVSGNTTANHFISPELDVYEGVYVRDTFIIDYNSEQRYILTNKSIDTTSIFVTSLEDNRSNLITYLPATSLLGLSAASKNYFVQAFEDDQYEIVFGDNILGRRPKDSSIITVEYRVSSGDVANDANRFIIDTDITNGDLTGDISVTTISPALGGAPQEGIESIRYNAPRYFQTQERAVVTADYETLLKIQFPEIHSVSVYGGEEVSPPRFGKVFVAISISDVLGFPESKKIQYANFLNQRMPLSIQAIMIDPDTLYFSADVSVNYNLNVTALRPDDIKTIVLAEILNYNEVHLNNFKSTLRYSKFITAIDNSHTSIISNETSLKVYRKLNPPLITPLNLNIKLGVPLLNEPGVSNVFSTEFTYLSQKVILECDGNGTVFLALATTHEHIKKLGTVDYSTGLVSLQNLQVDGYPGDSVRVFGTPAHRDILSTQNDILNTEVSEINITVSAVRE